MLSYWLVWRISSYTIAWGGVGLGWKHLDPSYLTLKHRGRLRKMKCDISSNPACQLENFVHHFVKARLCWSAPYFPVTSDSLNGHIMWERYNANQAGKYHSNWAKMQDHTHFGMDCGSRILLLNITQGQIMITFLMGFFFIIIYFSRATYEIIFPHSWIENLCGSEYKL